MTLQRILEMAGGYIGAKACVAGIEQMIRHPGLTAPLLSPDPHLDSDRLGSNAGSDSQ